MNAPPRPARILLVDDEPNVVETLHQALRMHHYQVTSCLTAPEARACLQRQHFDLLITDLRMPGEDGRALLQVARTLHPRPRTLLISAYGPPADDPELAELAHAYLPKPFTLRQFVQVVESQIGKARPNAPAPSSHPSLLQKLNARHVAQIFCQLPAGRAPSPEAGLSLYRELEQQLHTLHEEMRAEMVLVSDVLGQVVGAVGEARNADLANLLPLIGATFASVLELGHLLDDDHEASYLWHREGQQFDLYTANIGTHFVLVTLLGKRQDAVRTGMVWLAMRRTIERLRPTLQQSDWATASSQVDEGLATAIVADLDQLWDD